MTKGGRDANIRSDGDRPSLSPSVSGWPECSRIDGAGCGDGDSRRENTPENLREATRSQVVALPATQAEAILGAQYCRAHAQG